MNGLPPPTDRYITFFGAISPPATTNLRIGLCALVNEGAKKITILFASPGGSTDDGIALYTFLTALPVELTMHAAGVVASIAIPVFLASSNRIASKNARFMFHEYTWTYAQGNVTQTTMAGNTLALSEAVAWTKEIIIQRTKLTDGDFQTRRFFEQPVLMNPSDAVKAGLISDIAEPAMATATRPMVIIT